MSKKNLNDLFIQKRELVEISKKWYGRNSNNPYSSYIILSITRSCISPRSDS